MARPPSLLYHLTISTLLLLHLTTTTTTASLSPEAQTLLLFKSNSDTTIKLTNWNTTTHPDYCTWTGVTCRMTNNNKTVISRLVLESLDLQGTIAPLSSLTRLRVLSLKNNSLSGPIFDFSKFTSLKFLFLSFNEFSGEFPGSVVSLSRVFRLDLSHNNFSGNIPVVGLNKLTHLLTLRLEENRFSGSISGFNIPSLKDFNVSGNRLSGEIPKSFSGYPESAFERNAGLCGKPTRSCKGLVSNPTKPGSGSGSGGDSTNVVSSNPSSKPVTVTNNVSPSSNGHNKAGKISTLALICIIVGDVLVLAVIALLLYLYFWRSYAEKTRNGKGSSKLVESEKIVYSPNPYPNQAGFERGRMVFFEGVKRFELEDLLRASAEMLGKGGYGTAYKAVLDDGNVVAVKRLKDANVGGKREFEQQMEVLGRLRHQNLVSLRAYYFAREEKLLVYDYMPNGNLFWLLHGNRGPGRVPLDWTTRLKIAAGAARGLAFIHSSCKALKLVHGNIKSTNILLDKAGNARVSDFGLFLFASSATNPKFNGYRAPELSLPDGRNATQKSDVYAFGVLLLEILTGKCPSVVDSGNVSGAVDLPRWVQSVVREEWTAEVFDLELMRYKDIEEEMVGLLQIAMACASQSQDQRPRMSQVTKMIDEICGVEASPGHENSDTVSDSPCVSADDTCGASH